MRRAAYALAAFAIVCASAPAMAQQWYPAQTISYDALGRVTSVSDGLGTTTLTWDSLGRKTQMIDPDLGRWVYAYDANGNLTSQTDARGQTIAMQYDALNRVTLKDLPPTGTPDVYDVTYFYDGQRPTGCYSCYDPASGLTGVCNTTTLTCTGIAGEGGNDTVPGGNGSGSAGCNPSCAGKTCGPNADGCGGTCCLGSGCVAVGCGNCQTTDACGAVCVNSPSSTVCHTSQGVCDSTVHCTGNSATCPNSYLTTQCATATGPCQNDTYCTGTSASCPAATYKSSTTQCAAGAGCLNAAYCSGSAASCPSQSTVADQTSCAGGACLSGVCTPSIAGALSIQSGGNPQTNHGNLYIVAGSGTTTITGNYTVSQ